MSLSLGTRVGGYEVRGSLGTGRMGEVYRARDAQLNRDVALKVLPESFASDSDRVMRFTREAQTLAALNHPQIAQIYAFEQAAVDGRLKSAPTSSWNSSRARICRSASRASEDRAIACRFT